MTRGSAAGGGRNGILRPLRHGLLTTGLVLLVCAVLAAFAGTALASASARLATATGRAVGVVDGVRDDGAVPVRWTPPGATERVDAVPVAGTPPASGTRIEVAFDPARPDRPLVPGAEELVAADRALTALALTVVVAVLVLGVLAWQVVTRRRAFGQPARTVAVRRVRWQAGLATRSYLETDTHPRRFLPVHFDPVLVGLPSPTAARLHGDPLRDRWVAATVAGPDGERPLVPSGPVRTEEPRGRRTDNAARPDDTAPARAATLARMRRQLRADLPLVVPAPFLGLLWTYVDRGSPSTWLAVTALAAALGLWLAALRGSDPS
ncbi:DUF3592 domain-containing protein [Pseudonocardia sp. MH-G8]|uniref:DUF3592 domain-containing protein n=1 Tax=Pseudonocardia sp. MH-G8 TaxID=1854588 RepID=UPI000BA10D88|nr:DUF3592 domain-containing protein [Pseudonocardia sp. MH-G8]OZM83630.1 hypothetical protein CFP66_03815 [Pseudonocardia sp. MH-G8]